MTESKICNSTVRPASRGIRSRWQNVHTFDASARAPYQRYIPSMRTAQDSAGGSGTPIYDALCAEYRRLFRTLPGDRSGEEQMEFNGFSAWHGDYQGFSSPGRHRGNGGPAALPPGNGDNRLR